MVGQIEWCEDQSGEVLPWLGMLLEELLHWNYNLYKYDIYLDSYTFSSDRSQIRKHCIRSEQHEWWPWFSKKIYELTNLSWIFYIIKVCLCKKVFIFKISFYLRQCQAKPTKIDEILFVHQGFTICSYKNKVVKLKTNMACKYVLPDKLWMDWLQFSTSVRNVLVKIRVINKLV